MTYWADDRALDYEQRRLDAAQADALARMKRGPVHRDEYGNVTYLSQLRRRRLLQMAGLPFNHKAFYSQYCRLIGEGLVGWTIGFAYRRPAGDDELARLTRQGI